MAVSFPTEEGFRPSESDQQRLSAFSRNEALIGVGLIAAIVFVVGGFAVAMQLNRSSEPEILGGGAFVAYSELSPAAFNVVDGEPELRINNVMSYFGSQGDPGDLRPVNSQSGVFLVDPARRVVRSFSPSYQARGGDDTSSGLVPVAPADYEIRRTGTFGTPGEDQLFVVSRSETDASDSVLTTVNPLLVGTNNVAGLASIPGAVEQAVGVGTDIWLAVRDSDDPNDAWSLYVVDGAGDDEASSVDLVSDDGDGSEDGEEAPDGDDGGAEAFEPEQLTPVRSDDLAVRARLVSADNGELLASASTQDGQVRFHNPQGQTSSVIVERLIGATGLVGADGGSGAWFLAEDNDGWFVVQVRSSDRAVRLAEIEDSASVRFIRASVLGDSLIASDNEGRIWWVPTGELGETPVLTPVVREYPEAESDDGQQLRQQLARFPQDISVEHYANRVFVNVTDARLAWMFVPGSSEPVELDKGAVPVVEPANAGTAITEPDEVSDPNRNEEDTQPPRRDLETDEQLVDTDVFCEPDEVRDPVLQPQASAGPASSTTITVSWFFSGVTSAFCAPVVEVRVSGPGSNQSFPAEGSSTVVRDLRPESSYDVVIVAAYETEDGVEERFSNEVVYETRPQGPCPVGGVQASVSDEGYTIRWDPVVTRPDCGRGTSAQAVGYLVESNEGFVVPTDRNPGINTLEQNIGFTPQNIGRTVRFSVSAVAANGEISEPVESEPVTGNRGEQCDQWPVRIGPVNGSGRNPTFGASIKVPAGDELAWILGRRQEPGELLKFVFSTNDGPTARGELPSGDHNLVIENAPNDFADDLWEGTVTREDCDPVEVIGKNEPRDCNVSSPMDQADAVRVGKTFQWKITVGLNVVSDSSCAQRARTFLSVTAPDDCVTVANNVVTVSENCSFSNGGLTVTARYTASRGFAPATIELGRNYKAEDFSFLDPLPEGEGVSISCTWRVANAGEGTDPDKPWDCGTAGRHAPLMVFGRSIRTSEDRGPWGNQQPLTPESCSAEYIVNGERYTPSDPVHPVPVSGSCVFTLPSAPLPAPGNGEESEEDGGDVSNGAVTPNPIPEMPAAVAPASVSDMGRFTTPQLFPFQSRLGFPLGPPTSFPLPGGALRPLSGEPIRSQL